MTGGSNNNLKFLFELKLCYIVPCSPVKDEKLETIGKKLKKYNVSLDVVEFGESDDEKPEKLEALVAAVGGSSHIVHIPPGEDLRAVLAK